MERALHVVELLNSTDQLTLAQIVRASGLPRTTAYRVLRTLVDQGFATEWPELGTFGPGRVLERLASRHDPLGDVVNAVRPFARELSQKVRWPVSIATVRGREVVVRYATDGEAALGTAPMRPGVRLAMLESASGRLHLAHGDPAECALWLDMAYDPSSAERKPQEPRTALETELETIRRQGYASYTREGRLSMRRSLAAPVMGSNGMEASLVLRLSERAIRSRQELQSLVNELLAAAKRASAALEG
ncbi:MAG: helix-turn-helix domain-containing protein [Steroidobacteraceae bacterium]|nr:helix-turn-helix domain-containing protein [Steroidobacteraceae bacterium]